MAQNEMPQALPVAAAAAAEVPPHCPLVVLPAVVVAAAAGVPHSTLAEAKAAEAVVQLVQHSHSEVVQAVAVTPHHRKA